MSRCEKLSGLLVLPPLTVVISPFQDSSYLDELSNNNSLFSSPADSLSDIADPKDFLPADSLNHVPTLWDVNTPQQNQIEVWAAPLPSSPSDNKYLRLHPVVFSPRN